MPTVFHFGHSVPLSRCLKKCHPVAKRYLLRRCQPAAAYSTLVDLPQSANVVVVGGGVAGMSILYHLQESGCKNVVLIDENKVGEGMTALSGGVMSATHLWQYNQTKRLARATERLVRELSEKHDIGYSNCGRLILSRNLRSKDEAERMYSYAIARNNRAKILSPEDVAANFGDFVDTQDVKLGLILEDDFLIDPLQFIKALKEECRVIQDLDNHCLIGPSTAANGCIQASGFDQTKKGAPPPRKGLKPPAYYGADMDTKETQRAEREHWDCFLPVMSQLKEAFPFLGGQRVLGLNSGYEAVTSDGYPIIGRLPDFQNGFISTGWSGYGLSLAPGAGRLLAEWMTRGFVRRNMTNVSARRCIPLHYNMRFLKERAPEMFSVSGRLLRENHQFKRARNLRRSAIHRQLDSAGAIFGEVAGYERPLYYVPGLDRSASLEQREHMEWFDHVRDEYQACRGEAGLIDMSHLSKFDVYGDERDVVSFMQYLCSANVDRPVGACIYTGMQAENGGYMSDCTVVRMARDKFLVIAPTIQQAKLYHWLQRHVLEGGKKVQIQDVTSMYAAMNIVGPASRAIMTELTEEDMHVSKFPMFTYRQVSVGYASEVRALSVSHTGELGWILYVPDDFSKLVFEQIVEVGKEHGLRHAGYHTLRNLRMEKFFMYWGLDIDNSTTPAECGREFRVDYEKEFIGRSALIEQKKTGVHRRYVQLLVDDFDPYTDSWPMGEEPIYRNGLYSGVTTSAGYSFTFNCPVCIGYLRNYKDSSSLTGTLPIKMSWLQDRDAEYEIEIGGRRFPVRVNIHSPRIPMISSEHDIHYRPTQD